MTSIATTEASGLQRLLVHRIGPVATIAVAQLSGTALWFSANSTAADLMRLWHATEADIGWLTSAVQLGFILGTLSIALSGAADRFRASFIFVASAIAGALFNLGFAWLSTGLASGAALRFCVGICLAGIYPMGMKLIVGWAPHRTGQALAQLVAMLTLGTALPHAMRVIGAGLPWQLVITASSVLALLGACMIGVLRDGPHTLTKPRQTRPGQAPHAASRSVLQVFRIRAFRAATFIVIGIGGLGSLIGGAFSQRVGSARVALTALSVSGLCAIAFALGWQTLAPMPLFALLMLWGASVVADSPQFSALAAKACPPELVGSALAIQNAIGFAITVVSIAATTALIERIGLDATWLLVPGPILGLAGFSLTTLRARTAR
ncbi:MFS transporter [Cupriavidus neocaledonicus]|nr:MFS transporter [Cupriavidus neocaledonicus]